MAFALLWVLGALTAETPRVQAQEILPVAGSICRVLVDDPDDPTLNVRSSPQGAKVGVLQNGESLTILDMQRTSKGRLWARVPGGWVNAFYLTCQAEILPPLGSTCSVNTRDPDDPTLNVRSEPLGIKVDVLSKGAQVTIQAFSADASGRSWARIDGGWVYARFLECLPQIDEVETPTDVSPGQSSREAPRAGAPPSTHL